MINHCDNPANSSDDPKTTVLLMDNGPILVRAEVAEEDVTQGVRVDVIANTGAQRTLNLNIPAEVLSSISDNTAELQEKLKKFVNGLNGKIQSVGRSWKNDTYSS